LACTNGYGVAQWREHYNTVLSKSYEDPDEKWQESDQLGTGDLLNAARLLQRAEQWISVQ